MHQNKTSENKITMAQQLLYNTLRRLWTEHVVWTRAFVNSTIFGLPDLNPVTTRLLQNPGDFANVLSQYYGARTANRFEELLTEHLTIAADLVNALKAGDTKKAEEKNKQWYQNADEIAKFLGTINPYWDEGMWREMLFDHLDLLTEEIEDILSGNYEAGVKIFDTIQKQALQMADVMAEGMIKQFRIA